MIRNTTDVMGIPVDNVTMDEALKTVLSFLDSDGNHTVFTPNAEIMMAAHKDRKLEEILKGADLVIPDGAGVVLASRILGRPLKEKVPGFDLTKRLLEEKDAGLKFFLFGSKPGVAEKAAEYIRMNYPCATVAGMRNGYFTESDETEIVNHINRSGANALLAALGAPKQEKWIDSHKTELKVKVSIGVGGTLDVLAGTAVLAPEVFRRNGLEWLYRLYKQPSRFVRMLALPQYILRAIWFRIFK